MKLFQIGVVEKMKATTDSQYTN